MVTSDLQEIATQLIPLLDLTSLKDSDTTSSIEKLCKQAETLKGPVAAVCIYPKFVAFAKNYLAGTKIKIATVVNFPGGNWTLSDTAAEVMRAIRDGADEIDVVMPYPVYLKGDVNYVLEFLKICRGVINNKIMKVILETGALINSDRIADATTLAIDAGADFVKTSTGKISVNVTPEAATVILKTIKEYANGKVGFKVSGGINTVSQAGEYLELAKKIMGENWISPKTMRFGASRLLQDILQQFPAGTAS